MTSQETEAAAAPSASPGADERRRLSGRDRPSWRGTAVLVAVVLAASGGAGALAGWLWYQWWGPPNTGQIYDTTTWGPRWLDLSDQGLAHQFDGTAQFAVLGLGLGAVLGVLAAALGRRQAVAAFLALVAGSALAAYLCFAVGTALSPPDPQQFATKDNIGEEYRAAIEVSGWTPFLSWPIAAFGAFAIAVVVMTWLGTTRTRLGELQPLEPRRPTVKEPGDRPVR